MVPIGPQVGSPQLWQRILRAVLYLSVVIVVVLSGLAFRPTASMPRTEIQWPHLAVLFSVAFLVCLTYVNVYILAPHPELGESEKARRWRRTAASFVIAMLLFAFLVIPSVAYAFIARVDREIMAFILLFMVAPSVIYIVALFIKSDKFYSSNAVDPKIFLFRHQLITPGILLITIPFCVAYVVSNDVEWRPVSLMMASIELAYLLLCFTGKTRVWLVWWQPRVNWFFVGNAALFVGANITAALIPNVRFVLFAVWIGLYMTSFEYWTAVYFKVAENQIRHTLAMETIALDEQKYHEYFSIAAWCFTFICVFFPSSFLLDEKLSYVYLLATFGLGLVVWTAWLTTASTRTLSEETVGKLRGWKIIALALPVVIIIDSSSRYVPNFDLSMRSTVISLAVTVGLALYIGVPVALMSTGEGLSRVQPNSIFYWAGGVGMALVSALLGGFYEVAPLRFLALAWPYFWAHLIPAIVLVVVERAVIAKALSGQAGRRQEP